uniref:F-box domain-containing protein n=1 Tax=Kalanchoe fedtschenkoi TaxID=63787 RepID=A0A7N1A239_KALFE
MDRDQELSRLRVSGSDPNKRPKFTEEVARELPQHLHYSILLLLPVKSLLRFRSVSKSWNEIITGRSFSMDRISRPSRTEPVVTAIISYELDGTRSQISVDEICHESYRLLKPRKFVLPCEVIFISSSSCDGLSLISYWCFRKKTGYIRIWNSFTEASRDISWPEDFDREDSTFVGFGYDFKAQDYKVVMMTVASRESNQVQIHVTSLKSSFWRKVDAPMLAESVSASYDSVTVGEDIYWIARTESKNWVLLKFNVTEEKLRSILLPQEVISFASKKEVKLGHHNGALFLYSYEQDWQFGEDGPPAVDVWTRRIRSNGDKSAWRKVLNIPKPSAYNGHVIPLGITREGDFILVVWEGMGLKEYIVKQGRHVDLKVDRNLSRILGSWLLNQVSFVDTETLISP